MTKLIDIYKKLESDLSDTQTLETYIQLENYVNSKNFDIFSYISQKEKYKHVLPIVAANDAILYSLATSNVNDKLYPTLLAHSLLIKMSHNSQLSETQLLILGKILFNHKHHYLNGDAGTTLGYAIGYLIGKNIRKGIDVSVLSHLCVAPFVTNKEVFINGLIKANAPNECGLLFDKYYVNAFTERYEDNWSTVSRKICLKAFIAFGDNIKTEIPIINPANQKLLWFLRGLYSKNDYIYKLSNFYDTQIADQSFENIEPSIEKPMSKTLEKTVPSKNKIDFKKRL